MANGSSKRTIGCLIAVAILLLIGVTVMGLGLVLRGAEVGLPEFGPRVAVIEVFGVIGEDDRVLEQLDGMDQRGQPRAIVLHIDSPGGGAASTQRIVDRLETYRAEGIPIVAALESVAASGGYYIACSADSIVTLPGTLVGSIGVILAWPEFSALFTKLGIEYQVVTAGEYKDVGSMHRPLTEVERRWLEEVLQGVLEQFIDAIDRGRPELDRQEVRAVADGRIFSGEMAHAMGFADRIGSLDDAIAIAGDLAGLGEAPRIERVPVKQRLIDRILEERLGGLEALAGPRGRGWPQLEYRWR